jgi:hypothetical protein
MGSAEATDCWVPPDGAASGGSRSTRYKATQAHQMYAGSRGDRRLGVTGRGSSKGLEIEDVAAEGVKVLVIDGLVKGCDEGVDTSRLRGGRRRADRCLRVGEVASVFLDDAVVTALWPFFMFHGWDLEAEDDVETDGVDRVFHGGAVFGASRVPGTSKLAGFSGFIVGTWRRRRMMGGRCGPGIFLRVRRFRRCRARRFGSAQKIDSDASKSRRYAGCAYSSRCDAYRYWTYGGRAARAAIDFLGEKAAVVAGGDLGHQWREEVVAGSHRQFRLPEVRGQVLESRH